MTIVNMAGGYAGASDDISYLSQTADSNPYIKILGTVNTINRPSAGSMVEVIALRPNYTPSLARTALVSCMNLGGIITCVPIGRYDRYQVDATTIATEKPFATYNATFNDLDAQGAEFNDEGILYCYPVIYPAGSGTEYAVIGSPIGELAPIEIPYERVSSGLALEGVEDITVGDLGIGNQIFVSGTAMGRLYFALNCVFWS